MAKKIKYNENGIYVDCKKLSTVSNTISKKANNFAVEIPDCIDQSLGNAAEIEKNTIALHKTICTSSFSDMINSTTTLLNAIADGFNNKDINLSKRPDKTTAS